MAPVLSKFFTMTSRVKGDHNYNAKPKINAKCVYYLQPANSYSSQCYRCQDKRRPPNSAEPDSDVKVGQVPDAQANVLYRQCEFGYIIMTCIINDHSRAVPEGVWVQGGGIEIPCLYDVEIQEEVSRDVRKCLKENLKSLRANADGSAERRLQK